MSPDRPARSRPPHPRSVPVFILCGGLGTRLRQVESRPKAIIPIAGLPFLSYALRLLRLQGFRKIHLLLGVGAEQVRAVFPDPKLTCHREQTPLGTGGALAAVRREAAEWNLILNGDSYAEAIYPELLAAHAGRGPAASDGLTLLALQQDECADYGALEIAPDGAVTSFLEKGTRGPGWINAGVYAAGGGFFRDLPDGASSLEQDVLPELARRGRLWAKRGRFFFRDIGTPARLREAQREFRWIRNRMTEEEAVEWGGKPAGGPPLPEGGERNRR